MLARIKKTGDVISLKINAWAFDKRKELWPDDIAKGDIKYGELERIEQKEKPKKTTLNVGNLPYSLRVKYDSQFRLNEERKDDIMRDGVNY